MCVVRGGSREGGKEGGSGRGEEGRKGWKVTCCGDFRGAVVVGEVGDEWLVMMLVC